MILIEIVPGMLPSLPSLMYTLSVSAVGVLSADPTMGAV